jgi:hypothetical protein
VRKTLAFSVPPGYRRTKPPARPKLGAFTAIIDAILEADCFRLQDEEVNTDDVQIAAKVSPHTHRAVIRVSLKLFTE